MKQAVVYFEHMVRTLKLRDQSEPAQLLFKLRLAIAKAEKQEQCKEHGECFGGKCIYTTTPAQPAKQTPVAWAVFEGGNAHDLFLPQEYDEALKMAGYKGDHAEVKPLYTAPPQREKQEPVAYVTGTYAGRFVVKPLNPAMVLPVSMALYTTPQPQQTEKQEPVAFKSPHQRWEEGDDHDPRSEEIYKFIADVDFKHCGDSFCFKSGGDGDNGETLMFILDCWFASLPQPQQVKQEPKPVCWEGEDKCPNRQACCDAEECLYTPPPAAQWVGLTDEEVNAFVWNMPYEPGQAEIKAIEAKLKEKNT